MYPTQMSPEITTLMALGGLFFVNRTQKDVERDVLRAPLSQNKKIKKSRIRTPSSPKNKIKRDQTRTPATTDRSIRMNESNRKESSPIPTESNHLPTINPIWQSTIAITTAIITHARHAILSRKHHHVWKRGRETLFLFSQQKFVFTVNIFSRVGRKST